MISPQIVGAYLLGRLVTAATRRAIVATVSQDGAILTVGLVAVAAAAWFWSVQAFPGGGHLLG